MTRLLSPEARELLSAHRGFVVGLTAFGVVFAWLILGWMGAK